MENNFFENANEQISKVMEPAAKMNKLLMDHFSKMAEYQMNAAKSYGEITMQNLKDLSTIKDVESLKEYAGSQSERMGEVSKKVVEDLRNLGDMGAELRDEMEKVWKDAPQPAPKSTAKAAQK